MVGHEDDVHRRPRSRSVSEARDALMIEVKGIDGALATRLIPKIEAFIRALIEEAAH